jgi:hypothetical protein
MDNEMKNNQITYKGKIHWWPLLILWGICAFMIFAYIYYQRGANNVAALVVIGIFNIFSALISAFLFARRMVIDDEIVTLKFYCFDTVRINICQIKNVSVKEKNFFRICATTYSKYIDIHDFTRCILIIQTNNNKVYRIAIKSAQKIKEEIEKRMLTTNNKTSIT